MKKQKQKSTKNLTKLADDGVAFVKLTKAQEYEPKKTKKGATHKIEETPISVLAVPVKKWPKPPKAPDAAYGAPRISNEKASSAEPIQRLTVPEMPLGATHLEYATSTTAIVAPVTMISDFMGFRGTIRFGRLRYGDTFVSMMPGEEGQKGSGEKEVVVKAAPKAPTPSQSPAPSTSTASTGSPAPASKPAAPRKPDVPGVWQNGVRKPGAGGKTARVWEICDELLASLGRCPTKEEVCAISVDKEKASPGMTQTNFSYWRRFYDHKAGGAAK